MALNGLAGMLGNAINQITTPDTIRDRKHAAKLFNKTYNYPKITGLFHVYVDLNWEFVRKVRGLTDVTKAIFPYSGDEAKIGLLAKSFTLPSTTYDTETLNAYGKKTIVRKRVSYDPITITFHDDGDNTLFRFYRMMNLSYAYDTSENQVADATVVYKYRPRANDDVDGFSVYEPRRADHREWGIRKDVKPITSIRVYSLFAGYSTEYILMNPVITRWQLGTHDQSSSQPMEITATVQHEGVVFSQSGYPEAPEDSIAGGSFARESSYDKSSSPLEFGRMNLFGRGGLFASGAAAAGAVRSGNFLGAALIAGTTAATVKNANLKGAVAGEFGGITQNVSRGTSAGKYYFPAAVKKPVDAAPAGTTKPPTATS